jgi:phosphatidate cytidylyltransferase
VTVDEQQGRSEGVDDDESSAPENGPALTFGEDEGAALPHWSDPPTGELPVILDPEAGAGNGGAGRSRLFPEIPDDPNLVDESGTSVFTPIPPRPPEEPVSGTDEAGQSGPEASPFAPPPPESTAVEDAGVAAAGGAYGDVTAEAGPGPTEAGTQWGVPPSPGFEPGGPALTGYAAEPQAQPGPGLEPPLAPTASAGEGHPSQEPDPAADTAPAPTAAPESFPADAAAATAGAAAAAGAAAGAAAAHPDDPTERYDGGPDSGQGEEALEAWSALDTSAPHWREEAAHWDDATIHPTDPESERFFFGEDAEPEPAPMTGVESPRYDEATAARGADRGGGRDLPLAVGTGIGLGVLFLVLMWIGPGATMFLIVPMLGVAAAEFFVSVRRVGYRPATLLGLAAVVGLSLAAFWKGIEAYPAVLALYVVAGFLWYLVDADGERPTPNFAITSLGVLWVGALGSFAALMLSVPVHGTGLLLGAVVTTAAYDVGGFAIGRTTGQSRLAPHISPNKTWEGLIGGMIVAILVATVIFGFIGVAPWDVDTIDAVLLGIVVAVAAPLGDLAQSLIKRDLATKDMGHLLPGHGGLMDRFDGMVFALPAVYYLARIVVF